MAEPAQNYHEGEVASSAQPESRLSQANGERVATPLRDIPIPRPLHQMATAGFQAVNVPRLDQTERATAALPHTASAVTPKPAQLAAAMPSVTNIQPSASQVDTPDATMTDVGNYGTRSRNRTGNNRPNYAEDQEMDFELSSAATTNSKKKASNESAMAIAGLSAEIETKRAPEFGGGFTAVNSTPAAAGPSAPAAKVSTPNTAQATKKRKAPTQSANTTPSVVPATMRKSGAGSASASTPASVASRETNAMTFTKHRSSLNKRGELVADDGTKLCVNDHVYLVCEPPGDPYYLCRIMEFLHVDSDNPNSPVDSLRVNWYYRPRDVQRFNSDTRLVYGTMHSDMCPLTSLRGKCIIKHRSEIDDLEAYRKERDSFYFVQVFDRFIRRWYECIPVAQIINVPEKVKKALDERWRFVVVEISRVKELTSAVKTCKRCTRFCASQDSVDCAICKNSYHMNCVQPPLPKKPSRGFAWACGPCSRQHEAGNTPNTSGTEAEEELIEEDELAGNSNDNTRAPSPSGSDIVVDDHPATQAEIALAKMWPMRYLGIHARLEDALQYDDRAIYPRASSRLGPRHQANVNIWHGRSVELVKPAEIKKRYTKGSSTKTQGKLTKETLAAMEADREEKAKRPKWVQDEPSGYIARGEDFPNDDPRCTAKVMFKLSETGVLPARSMYDKPTTEGRDFIIDEYVKRAKAISRSIGVPPFGTNFLDKAVELLSANDFDTEAALKQLQKINRVDDLHEPVLSKAELAKFEEGVAKYGSEHRLVRLNMKTTLPNSDIVRFYYLWKKTPKGREIWGNYGGRKGAKRKPDTDLGAKLQAEVAHDADDSAYDNDKAVRRNRGFVCKFCNTTHARQWRKAPGVSAGQTLLVESKNGKQDKKERLILALCSRCAGLWRKYAIQWEDIDEVAKKVASGGGRALKRRIDEELLRELLIANDTANAPGQEQAVPSIEGSEPPKKKSKTDALPAEPPKKKEKPPPPPKLPTPPPPPIIPAQPVMKILPCAVCKEAGDTIACGHCMLTVHRRCFGLGENEGVKATGEINWICEQCQNDRNPSVSTEYSCRLCLSEETMIDIVEPPKISHKKKTDREKEKERMEKELADGMRADYRAKQLLMNRPVMPREPLKRTTGNNWVHVHCAVWTPEIRFSNARTFEVAEGFQSISQSKWEAVCKLCKNKDLWNRTRENAGACISCFQCQASFHASCAFEAGYQFGFDVTPVKGSRKDQVTTASLGQETGALTAGVWCKEHVVKTIVHPIHKKVDETGKTALQVFVENYKQADLTLTGTVRKANLVQLTRDKNPQATSVASNINRRESAANSIAAAVRRGARTSSVADAKAEAEDASTADLSEIPDAEDAKRCVSCNTDTTPRWHPAEQPKEPTPPPSPLRALVAVEEVKDPETQQQRRGDTDPAAQTSTASDPPSFLSSVPADRPSSTEPNSNNIRFMPPGASGRAWEGMFDRRASHSPATVTLGQPSQLSSGLPTSERANPVTNGDHASAPAVQEAATQSADDVFTNHALPQFQTPAAVPTSATQSNEAGANSANTMLCHKCWVKRKLNPTPTPPPPPSPKRATPTIIKFQLDPEPTSAPPAPTPREQPPGIPPQFPSPWDNPPRPAQGPPPIGPPAPLNGMPSSQAYGPPPHNQYGPPPQYGPPNGYHHMHERHHSYGYGRQPPQPPPPPPSIPPMYGGPTHPNSIGGFPGPGPPHVNPSPAYLQHAYQHPPRRTESPFMSHNIGQPLHARSPSLGVVAAQGSPGMGMPPQPQPSPHMSQPDSQQQIGGPVTPPLDPSLGTTAAVGHGGGVLTAAINGASASPSLRNLLS